jgi:hypothetical protein
MECMTDVDRAAVVAYRVAAHQLDRSCSAPADLAVLDLGVQVTRGESAAIALTARLPEPANTDELVSTWTFRGAPHFHRPGDLARLAGELWPADDADGAARLGQSCKALQAAKVPATKAIRDTAQAWRKIAGKTAMTKGEVSAAVTARLPESYSYPCRGCKSVHVLEQLLRVAGLPAGAVIAAAGPPVSFVIEPKRTVPTRSAGMDRLIRAYLELHGPASIAEVAGYLGTTAAVFKSSWPDDLAEVRVGGSRRFAVDADAVAAAPAPKLVRLLPPYDPYLTGDRGMLVPDKARHKAVWQILGNPGALLIDGEIAGVWRAKAGSGKFALTVTAFATVPRGRRSDVESEAQRLAVVRDQRLAGITYD